VLVLIFLASYKQTHAYFQDVLFQDVLFQDVLFQDVLFQDVLLRYVLLRYIYHFKTTKETFLKRQPKSFYALIIRIIKI